MNNPARMSLMYISQAIAFTVAALAIRSVFSYDCSPPSREALCECTTTSIHCSGSATDVSEFQSVLTLANASLMETFILKISDLKLEPDFTFENTSIQNLTLGYNFQDFPSHFFAGSFSLISLNLQNNSIGSIDDQLFSTLLNLKELFLDENYLQELTSSNFANLAHLNYLSIANNHLQKIDEQVFQNLPNLQNLVLSHNNFSSIENLKLSSKSLIKLEITHCPMKGVLEKGTFSSVPQLEHLDMSHNRITEIQHESMSALKNMKFLNLSNNNIKILQERAFSEMRNLTSLDLRENEISVIKISSFNHLHNLKYLDLSGNKLTVVLCEYTTDFHSLERINLQNNRIKSFSQGAFFYSPHLQAMDLTGNTLECSCPLTDTALHLIANSTIKREDLELVSCVIPATLASESVMNYKSSKCVPEEPCKKLDAPEPEDEDYDEDYYHEDKSTTESKTSTMTSTRIQTNMPTPERTTITMKSTAQQSATPTAERTTITEKSTEPQSTAPTAERTTITEKSTEPQSATTTAERTTMTMKSTEPQSATPTAEHTSSTTIPITTESSSKRKRELIMSTTSISSTIPATVSPTTENINLSITQETNIVTKLTSSETRLSSSDVTKQSTKNVDTSGVSTTNDCSSLNLNVHQPSADSEFLVLSNFSYEGNTFCLKWSIVGNLTNVKRCSIKYSYEGKKGSPSSHLTCPSVANEILTWSFDKKIFRFCINVYNQKFGKTGFCNYTFDETTTVLTTPQSTTPTVERTTITEKSTEPQSATPTAEHTSPTTIPITTESSSKRTTELIMSTTSIASTIPATVSPTTENINLTTTHETNIVTKSTSSETRLLSSYVPKQSTKNTDTSGVSTTNDCSSLNLNVHQPSADSEFLVLSNFSYDGNTFCLKWSIVGNLTNVKRCTIKYVYEGIEGSPTSYLTCPSVANEILTWLRDKKILRFCINIYNQKIERTAFCKDTFDETTTVFTTPSSPPLPEYSETIPKLETNPPNFDITALNVYFNNSNLAFATWAVNREAPQLCNMTLKATTQYLEYVEGVFPCKNNSHRLRYVKETDIFKICLFSQHKTSGSLTKCTPLSTSLALASKYEKDDKDSVSGSMILLICLLVLLVLIVLFIIFKNIFKKKPETNKYEVRAEEVNYQQMVIIRP